mmetsp:Transcript_29331/g.51367  ORF Transcript_29331/g.51367 Transcript_29331/m.51367 type:complete len:454 (+) Transcript_29331:75-1436(+)
MEDAIEARRQKWLSQQQQEQGASAKEPASTNAAAPSEQAHPSDANPEYITNDEPEEGAEHTASHTPNVASMQSSAASSSSGREPQSLSRLHILPFAEADARIAGQSRIEVIAPELRRIRAAKEVCRSGDLIVHNSLEFAIINCEPEEGLLDVNTDYFLDGTPLVCFEKIQFSAWGPVEMSNDQLFSECIAKYFKGDYSPYKALGSKRVRLFSNDFVFQIGDNWLQVEATEPPGLGVVTTQTEIFANWDQTSEFERIHIVPFQDTLPRAYEYDIFVDYLRPYLVRNPHKKFQMNDLFTWQGVQFKVVAIEPEDRAARIGKGTTIFCEGVLHPSLRNLLPPELLQQVSQLPRGLQMLLLSTERTTRELEDMLSHRRGLFEETLGEIERFTWPAGGEGQGGQSTCMICLGEFSEGEDCRRLPCRHVFHSSCVDEWLRRCTDCPICKANVDRAIRNY